MNHNNICKINIVMKVYMSDKNKLNLEIEEITEDETLYDYQKLIKMFDGEKNIPIRKNKSKQINNKIFEKSENILETKKNGSEVNITEIDKINEIKNLEEEMEEKIEVDTITIRKKQKFKLQNVQKKRDILKGILSKKTHDQKRNNRPFLMRLTKK